MSSNSFQRPSPVILSSSCVVQAGNTNVPDYSQLSYPFRKALLISEIRFDLFCNAVGFSVPLDGNSPQLGSVVYGQFQLGRHYLNRDFAPIWLLGTQMTQFEEGNIDTTLATVFAYSHYRWLFASPLYVEAGETLRSTFSRAVPALLGIPAAAAITNDITVQVSYVGRVMPPNAPRPKTIAVPYVAPFMTTWNNTYQQSNEYNLFNPFDKPIRVQRMTGRVLGTATTQGSLAAAKKLTPGVANASMEVQMFDSWGGKIVNDITGPSDVWDNTRYAWTFDTIIPPKGQYEARVFNISTGVAFPEQLHVAMIGEREEAL